MNSAKCKLCMEDKYIKKATPQQSYLVELGFAILVKKGGAMMTNTHLLQNMRLSLCKEAFVCTTLLDNLTIKTIICRTVTQYEHFHNKKPSFARTCKLSGRHVQPKQANGGKLGDR